MERDAPAGDTATTATAATAAAAASRRLHTYGLLVQRRDRPAQPFLEPDLRLPAEDLARSGDVRLPDLRIVLGQRLEDDLALRPRDPHHHLGELEQRELVRIADVDRHVLVAVREQIEAADQIVDVAEAARLR